MMVRAYVHRILGFGENAQSVQKPFFTLFVWNTVNPCARDFFLHHIATGTPCNFMLQCKNKNFYFCNVLQRVSKSFNLHFRSQQDGNKNIVNQA